MLEIDEDLLRRAFSARRKQLRNALMLADAVYARLAIDPKLRPENLSPGDYARLTVAVRAEKNVVSP
jgi:16S rRNA A1518/A1519 N6-dimethyltransferase RsmA/KsgA/DIM1 with predicted DNA glycosylase/AP lyase activity